jgi:O-antigen/teichoic acid export membrane protein
MSGPIASTPPLGKTAKLSAVWDFSARLLTQALMFCASVFVARLLTPEDFGITAAGRFFITLASRMTQLGLNASLVRMKAIDAHHASSVFVVNLLMGVLAFVALVSASPHIGAFFGSPEVGYVVPVAATVFLISPFATVSAAMLQRHLRFKVSTVIGASDALSGAAMSLVFAWWGWGYWSLICGSLFGTLLSTVARVYVSPWRPSVRFSFRAFREVLSFGLGFQAKRLLYFSTSNIDNLLVGRLLGMVSLGFYDKSYSLMNQITDRMAFDTSLMRIFSLIHDDAERFRRALLKAVEGTATVSFPLLVFAVVTADHMIPALFGPQWAPSVAPFRVLALVGLVRMSTRAVFSANEALGAVWIQTAFQAIAVVLMVAGVVVGSKWGLTSAAVGVLVAVAIDAVLNCWWLTRSTTVTGRDLVSSLAAPLGIASTLGVFVFGLNLALASAGVTGNWKYLMADLVLAAMCVPLMLVWCPFPSVRAIVQESIDELAPRLRRWAPQSRDRNA